jgi:hypothetical protein
MKSKAHASAPTSGPTPGPKSNSKSRPADEEGPGSEPSGNAATNTGSVKTANSGPAPAKADPAPQNSDPVPAKADTAPVKAGIAVAKSDPTPIVMAADPTPAPDPPAIVKAVEPSADQPRSTADTALALQVFALPPPIAPAASPAAGIPVAPPTEPTQDASGQDATEAPTDPGNLVFQLSLDSSQPAPQAQIAPPEHTGNPALLSGEWVPAAPQVHAGASESDSTDQNQQEQAPLPQPLPTGTDGTIASQFGFQTPLSFAAQIPAAKAQNVPAAPAPRSLENVSNPDPSMAPSVDRVGLTIRGADDQVVRVEINQSGDLVQVGVRTGNSDLANELRASVPELMHRLDQQGYESRVSMPSSSYASLASPVVASAQAEFRSGADTSGYAKSNGNPAPQEELREQRHRNPQRAWRELASQLQED